MWCSHCQQDVPAFRGEAGLVACPRCRCSLVAANLRPAHITRLVDCGIQLESFDKPSEEASRDGAAVLDFDHTRTALRQLSRRLRPGIRSELTCGQRVSLLVEPSVDAEWEPVAGSLTAASLPSTFRRPPRSSSSASGLYALAFLGIALFAFGVAGLTWGAILARPLVWQWSLSAAIAGQGTVVVALTGMATRLRRNGRTIHRQLQGVHRRLDEIQTTAGRIPFAQKISARGAIDHVSAL